MRERTSSRSLRERCGEVKSPRGIGRYPNVFAGKKEKKGSSHKRRAVRDRDADRRTREEGEEDAEGGERFRATFRRFESFHDLINKFAPTHRKPVPYRTADRPPPSSGDIDAESIFSRNPFLSESRSCRLINEIKRINFKNANRT